jgi:hypothetical protein
VLIFLALPVIAMLFQWRKLQSRWLWITLIIWFMLYTVFNWFWEPGSVKYWLIPIMCWWIVLSLILDHLKNMRWYRYTLVSAAAFIAAIFVINFTTQFLPEGQPGNDPSLTVADTIRANTNANDLFVTDHMEVDFYIAYFADRNVVSIGLINEATGSGDVAAQIVKNQLERHRADDGQIYVYTQDRTNLPSLAEAVGLKSTDQLEIIWEFPNVTIYRALYD